MVFGLAVWSDSVTTAHLQVGNQDMITNHIYGQKGLCQSIVTISVHLLKVKQVYTQMS